MAHGVYRPNILARVVSRQSTLTADMTARPSYVGSRRHTSQQVGPTLAVVVCVRGNETWSITSTVHWSVSFFCSTAGFLGHSSEGSTLIFSKRIKVFSAIQYVCGFACS